MAISRGQTYGLLREARSNDNRTFPNPWAIQFIESSPAPIEGLPEGQTPERDQAHQKEQEQRREWLMDQFKIQESPFFQGRPERMNQAITLLLEYYDLFSQGDKYGCTSLVEHEICTRDIPPIKTKGLPINPMMEGKLREQLNIWLKQEVVQPSSSPWSFPLIAIPKKNGKTRWVIDYRCLNEITIKDSFPLPNIEDNLARLADSQIFSGIDGAGAFYVIPIRKEDRPKTAFSTPWGLFEFACMPFGLCNALATYSRLVQKILDDIPTSMALPYLDNTCIHSRTFEEHIEILGAVFEAHCKAGLTLQPDKCHLFRTSIEYVGHVISAKGISPLPSHQEAVRNWEFPTTVTQMRAFLGKTN